MHVRRLATLLLGAWLAGCFFMTWVATGNFASVERVLKTPSAKAQRELTDIGLARSRALLRFQASEQNRHYFYNWETVQLVLAVVVAVVLLFATNGDKLVMGLSVFMLAIVVIQHFTMTPQVIEVGRVIDFASSDELTAEKEMFWNLHKAYTVVELSKMAGGIILGIRMIYMSHQLKRRGSSSRKKVNAVDHADHTHVNG